MQQWEYKVIVLSERYHDAPDQEQTINMMAAQGWRLVSVVYRQKTPNSGEFNAILLYFERPKP